MGGMASLSLYGDGDFPTLGCSPDPRDQLANLSPY